jgi:hypothetical protein
MIKLENRQINLCTSIYETNCILIFFIELSEKIGIQFPVQTINDTVKSSFFFRPPEHYISRPVGNNPIHRYAFNRILPV